MLLKTLNFTMVYTVTHIAVVRPAKKNLVTALASASRAVLELR